MQWMPLVETATPKSKRLMHNPLTMSCRWTDREKQKVLLPNRLMLHVAANGRVVLDLVDAHLSSSVYAL
jgi:hypothetical protein